MQVNNKISIAKKKDANEIMDFIKKEWKKNHILAINKEYFLYEYQNKKFLNFVICRNSFNQISATLGFIKSSSNKSASVWTTMWKVSKSNGSPMLGIKMLNYLRRKNFKSVMSIGINPRTEEIYKFLKFNVGNLNHYYIVNKGLRKYKIAKVPKNVPVGKFEFAKIKKLFFKKINTPSLLSRFDFKKYKHRLPFKDFNYFKKKFFGHPIYCYDVYGVFDKYSLLSILVTRICKYKKSTCMKIVDFYGKESTLNTFIFNLEKIMINKGHEYIDLFARGLNEKTILKAGFVKLNINKNDIIIPNYFEPFVRSNVHIKYFSDTKELKQLRIYRSDGDQDRPNQSNSRKNHG
jgi:hypothetical protein